MGLGTQKAPEAARPLPLLYSSASDFQFRYAPVAIILGYKNQRDAIQRHVEKFDVDFYPENRHHHMTQTGSGCVNIPCKQQHRYMSDILCCRYIIILWNLNLIGKDIFD